MISDFIVEADSAESLRRYIEDYGPDLWSADSEANLVSEVSVTVIRSIKHHP